MAFCRHTGWYYNSFRVISVCLSAQFGLPAHVELFSAPLNLLRAISRLDPILVAVPFVGEVASLTPGLVAVAR